MTAANRKNTTPEPLGRLRRSARRGPDRCDGRTGRRGPDAGCAEGEKHQGEGEVGNPEPRAAPVAHLSHDYGTSGAPVHRSGRAPGGHDGDENGRSTATKTSLDAGLAAAHAHRVVRMSRWGAFQGS